MSALPEERRPLRLTVYSDAREFAGAEQAVTTVLGALAAHVDASVLGVDRDVVDAIAASRPGTKAVVVAPVRGKFDVPRIREHCAAVRDLRPDVFQLNMQTTWSCQYGIIAALRYRHAPIVAIEHAPIDGATGFQLRMKRNLAGRFAAHVAASAFSARCVEAHAGLPAGTVEVIPWGVADEPAQAAAPGERGPAIAAVGRLVPEKGFDVLIRALPSLPGLTAEIVGEGLERARLEALAAELGVADRVVFAGWLDRFRERLAEVDVVVAPSRFEAFGISLVEAMLASRPVVASRVGGIPEVVVDGETGLLVPPGDPAALARAVQRLLDDAALRERLGANGRERALERYGPERAARAFEALYDDVMSRRSLQ